MPGAVDGPESAMARAVHCSRQDVFVLRSYVFIARFAQSSSDDLDLGHEQAGQIWPGSSSPSGSPDRQSSPRLWSQCRHPSRRRTGWGGGVARQRGGRDERRKSGGAAEQGAPSERGERSGRRAKRAERAERAESGAGGDWSCPWADCVARQLESAHTF